LRTLQYIGKSNNNWKNALKVIRILDDVVLPSQLLETPLSAAVSWSFIARNSTVRCTTLVFYGSYIYMPPY
jgi:hypothetical protein